MNQRSPSAIAQRVIQWVKARMQSGDASGTSSGSGESGRFALISTVARQILGNLKDAAGEARTRGKQAFDQLQSRRKEQPDSASPGSGSSSMAPMERAEVPSSTAGQPGSDPRAPQPGQPERDVPAAEGDRESVAAPPVNPSSIAWASTAGVIDTDLTTPSSFIESEQGSASTSAQRADPNAGPAERAAETNEDVTAQVAGNAEQGTRLEAATDAQRATTNTPRVESLREAPDDPIGGPEDRAPGTESATTSTEPYAFGPSQDQGTGDRDDAPAASERSSASDRERPSASGAATAEHQPPSTGAPTTGMTSSSSAEGSAGGGTDGSSTSVTAPVGDDGLPIYFDAADTSGPDTRDGGSAGAGAAPSTTALSADAYRSTTAPEEMTTGGEGSTGSERPGLGSTIPDFATDSDSSTRIVESPHSSTSASSQDRGGSPSIVRLETGDAPPAGVGVTVDEPTGQVPGDFEPNADPAAGQARAGTDTHRRGDAGLGSGQTGSSEDRSAFDDVQVSDVAAADPSGEDVTAPNTITQQEPAGAVDTADPEGISRKIVRDANRPGNCGSTPSTPPKGSGGSGGTRRSRSNRRDRGR